MHDHDTPLFARDDTMLGVCHGLGEELGISPAWFRIALALGLFWHWEAVLIGYAAAAVVVNLLHWLLPIRRSAVRAISCFSSSFVLPLFSLFMSVRVEPGASTFTRMPFGPSSAASTRVRTSMAPLVAEYTTAPG